MMNNLLIKIFLALLLFGCLFNMPYGYYQIVRYISTVCFVCFAYLANIQNNKNEVFIFIALAILFQPFLKIALGRTVWNVVNAIIGIGLLLSLLKNKPER